VCIDPFRAAENASKALYDIRKSTDFGSKEESKKAKKTHISPQALFSSFPEQNPAGWIPAWAKARLWPTAASLIRRFCISTKLKAAVKRQAAY
jgi:hypothetical protein